MRDYARSVIDNASKKWYDGLEVITIPKPLGLLVVRPILTHSEVAILQNSTLSGVKKMLSQLQLHTYLTESCEIHKILNKKNSLLIFKI
jgi:hypothetical protein